jgi:hypothetical protein
MLQSTFIIRMFPLQTVLFPWCPLQHFYTLRNLSWVFTPKEQTWIFAASAFLGTFFWNWLNSLSFRVSSLLEILLRKGDPCFLCLTGSTLLTEELHTCPHRCCSAKSLVWSSHQWATPHLCEKPHPQWTTTHHNSYATPQWITPHPRWDTPQPNELRHTPNEPLHSPHPIDLRHTPKKYVTPHLCFTFVGMGSIPLVR